MITPNTNKSLSDIFDVELTVTDTSHAELQLAAKAESIDSLEVQRKYVKNNIVALIEKGNDALDVMITIAKTTEANKDFTVVAELLKTLVDTNIKLLDCEVAHKPKTDQPEVPGVVNNTAVFVGSTTELDNYLKNSKKL